MTTKENPGAGNAGAVVSEASGSTTKQISTEQGVRWRHNDGGRSEAGFQGRTGDCVCRSIAIATGKPYVEVYDELRDLGWNCWESWNRSYRSNEEYWLTHSDFCDPEEDIYLSEKEFRQIGFWRDPDDASAISDEEALRRETTYLKSLGWQYTATNSVHWRALPDGRLIVQISGHLVAVIDGVIHDTFDCSRGGTACIEGYWSEH
jgi:hypothetical protein